MTFSNVGRLDADADATDVSLAMDEDAFRLFYERTAPSLLSYLCRMTGSREAADDVLQDSYYRLLRSPQPFEDDTHRKNYLFRIATNLVYDAHRAAAGRGVERALSDTSAGEARSHETRAEVRNAMERLAPRDRALLWLAYAEGSSHGEIADALGLKRASIKVLLFRARTRLAGLLRGTPPEGRRS
jgi:RNA polymerase sigma-70 factor (ECF subfamily)